MKFSLIALLGATTALAAPAPEPEVGAVNMMAAAPQWTIKSMQRSCNKADTECTWNFGIYPGSGKTTTAKFVVKGKAAHTLNGKAQNFGDYTVTSGWSNQFGKGNEFTTFSVVNNKSKQIVYPAYTDKQVSSGKVVKPDQSYSPQALP